MKYNFISLIGILNTFEETSNIYDDSSSLSQEDKNFLLQALSAENSREMGEALLKDFASDYEIEVNYNRMGLTDE